MAIAAVLVPGEGLECMAGMKQAGRKAGRQAGRRAVLPPVNRLSMTMETMSTNDIMYA
jgi:hypothetical protein